MTRKSEGRLKRDAMAAAVKQEGLVSPYVELEQLYQTQRKLFQPYYNMALLISNPEISKYLKDITHTTNLVRGLAADAKDLFARMEAEHQLHAGKDTSPERIDENENWTIIQHFQQYQVFHGVHTQTILPIMLELDEHLKYAVTLKEETESAAIAAATAAHAADQAIVQAAATETVVANEPTAAVNTAPTMAGYEAAASTIQ